MKGISTALSCNTRVTALKNANVKFVARYYSETTQLSQKRITLDEAQSLDQEGIRIVSVYQDRQNQYKDFTKPAGHRDGRFAHDSAKKLGQPHDTTIFFSVDYDAEPPDHTEIKNYFKGVAQGLSEMGGGSAKYTIGVYGSGLVCKMLKNANLVQHTWVAESTGWHGTDTFNDWDIKQSIAHQPLANFPIASGRYQYEDCVGQGEASKWSFKLKDIKHNPLDITIGILRKGANGADVLILQNALNVWLSSAQAPILLLDGDFGLKTQKAVMQFQSTHVDNAGRSLLPDGVVGGLTWEAICRVVNGNASPNSLTYDIEGKINEWWKKMPDPSFGGSARGLAALAIAINEAKIGAKEIGGNNSGKFVKKYLNGKADEGASWCAAFVSWCLKESGEMPFKYNLGARDFLRLAKNAGYEVTNNLVDRKPLPGDIIVWWREAVNSWKGHTGFVHHVEGGVIFTIEGNKTSRVEGFDYALVSMEKLLGVIHLEKTDIV